MTPSERRAELALQMVQLVQMHGRPNAELKRWNHLPDLSVPLSWDGMRDRLAAAAKPLLLLPGNEPGMLATWGPDQVPKAGRGAAEHYFRNQVEYYTEKLKMCELGPETTLRLRRGEVLHSLTVAEFLEFVHEYGIGARITIGRAEAPGEGVIMIFGPGGGVGPITDGEERHQHGPGCDHGH